MARIWWLMKQVEFKRAVKIFHRNSGKEKRVLIQISQLKFMWEMPG